MLIQVDPSNNRPIYQQIVSQITYGVAAGTLPASQAIPSVRQLAAELLVNPNTIARAYRELQALGILEQRRGLGLFVTDKGPKLCRKARVQQVRERLRDVLREAVSSELPVAEIENMMQQELKRLS